MTTAYEVARKELYSCSASDTISTVADMLQKNKVSCVLVKNKKEEFVGLVTVGDILRAVSVELESSETAADLMSPLRAVTPQDTPLEDMPSIFRKEKVTRIPLADKDGSIVGMVRDKDVDRLLTYERAHSYLKGLRHRRF